MVVVVFLHPLPCMAQGPSRILCLNYETNPTGSCLKQEITERLGFPLDELHLFKSKNVLQDEDVLENGQTIYIQSRLKGGKGGFGSMLRAIGAQIEKTTNKEACRDLSGRRLRDINEEKRLKKWIAKQAEREREKAERKRLRLERMKTAPHHDFHDSNYDKQRSSLAENMSDALSQGLQSSGVKRKVPQASASNEPRKKVWLGAGEFDIDGGSSSSSESEDEKSEASATKSINTSSESSQSSMDSTSSSSSEAGKQSTEVETHKPSCSKSQIAVTEPLKSTEYTTLDASETEKAPCFEKLSLKQQGKETPKQDDILNLDECNSIEEIEKLGLERTKTILMSLGMKCGGTLQQRAERLMSVKGLKPEEIPSTLLAKTIRSLK